MRLGLNYHLKQIWLKQLRSKICQQKTETFDD